MRADVWVLLGPHRGTTVRFLPSPKDWVSRSIPFRCATAGSPTAGGPAKCRGLAVDPEARAEIAPPWPSLVIGIGQRSAPVARYIKEASGGRTTIVRLGDPMVSPAYFDLVITTPQYAVRDAENVVRSTGHDHQSPDHPRCRGAALACTIPAPSPTDRDGRRNVAVATTARRRSAKRQRHCASSPGATADRLSP